MYIKPKVVTKNRLYYILDYVSSVKFVKTFILTTFFIIKWQWQKNISSYPGKQSGKLFFTQAFEF